MYMHLGWDIWITNSKMVFWKLLKYYYNPSVEWWTFILFTVMSAKPGCKCASCVKLVLQVTSLSLFECHFCPLTVHHHVLSEFICNKTIWSSVLHLNSHLFKCMSTCACACERQFMWRCDVRWFFIHGRLIIKYHTFISYK